MNIVDRIRENPLPIKQLRVIEKILDDLESSSLMSGAELCDKFDISFSSLTRMAKTLRYSGFPELKKDIERLYRDEFSPSHKAESFIKDSRDKSILNIVLQSELKNMKKLHSTLHEQDMIECAKKINKAKRVFIVGVGQMNPIANKFTQSLKLLSKNTICFTELGFSKQIEMHSISKSDIVVLFSINKELIEFNDFLTSTNATDTFSILFTDKKAGRLRQSSSISFHAPSSGNGMINCITPFLVCTNILESLLFSLDKHVHLSKIRNIEKKWNSLPIFLK